MATEEPEGMEEVERVNIEGIAGGEGAEAEGEAAEEGAESEAEGEGEGAAPTGPKEVLVRRNPVTPTPAPAAPAAQAPAAAATPADANNPLVRLPDETPREYALRLENHGLRQTLKKDRGAEIFQPSPATAPPQRTLSPEAKKVLEKYKPEEIASLREVMPAIAEELGFVRADQLQQNTYTGTAQDQLDTFLEAHPEYLPANDKDGTLWNAFREASKAYNMQPKDPKDFKRIFNKVHQDVFGIQPAQTQGGQAAAARAKVNVASHASTPQPSSPGVSPQRPKTNTAGVRLDMLKGFSQDEIEEMTG